jgi:predicted deacylase
MFTYRFASYAGLLPMLAKLPLIFRFAKPTTTFMLNNILPAHHFKSISFQGLEAGTRLIVTGAVHGNETCGTQAIMRVLREIDEGKIVIRCGRVTFVPITNPLAYAKGERTGDRNLNRNLAPTDQPHDFEDHIANWLCPLFAQHDVLLDLHSTRAKNPAFAMLGPLNNNGSLQPFKHFEKERALAKHLGVKRFVDGWLSTYAIGVERRIARAHELGIALDPLNTDARYGIGTTEYMRSVGGYSITLECGQHDDPESPEVGYRAIKNSLAFLGLIDAPTPKPVENDERLNMFDVIDKWHEGDTFAREWASFHTLKVGDLIGTRHSGEQVRASHDGFILFPDAKATAGHEWFYLAHAQV